MKLLAREAMEILDCDAITLLELVSEDKLGLAYLNCGNAGHALLFEKYEVEAVYRLTIGSSVKKWKRPMAGEMYLIASSADAVLIFRFHSLRTFRSATQRYSTWLWSSGMARN